MTGGTWLGRWMLIAFTAVFVLSAIGETVLMVLHNGFTLREVSGIALVGGIVLYLWQGARWVLVGLSAVGLVWLVRVLSGGPGTDDGLDDSGCTRSTRRCACSASAW
jgi:hypothetical protein